MRNKLTPTSRVILFLGCLFLAFLFLLLDDELTAETKQLLEEPPTDKNNSSYFYLMGIMASENESPLEVGKNIYASIVASEEAYENKKAFTYIEYPENKRLPLPSGELFCSDWNNTCLATMFSKINSLNETENATLLKRYLEFMEIPDFRNLSKPRPEEIYIPYQYIVKGSHAFLLKNIKIAADGNPKKATSDLLKNITQTRKKMETADNLLFKVIYASILSHTIDTVYVINKKFKTSKKIKLDSLTADEMDFSAVFKREFTAYYNYFKYLDKNPHIFNEKDYYPPVIVRMVFKPNMTANGVSIYYSNLIKLSRSEPIDFTVETSRSREKQKHSNSIRNFVGDRLVAVAPPNFDKFIARKYDLSIKIDLFNKTIHLSDDEIKKLEIHNPYYKRNEKLIIERYRACVSGPLEDINSIRCIPLI